MTLIITPTENNGLVFYQGSTFRADFQWTINGSGVEMQRDFSEIRAYIRHRYTDTSPLISMSSNNSTGPRVDNSGWSGGAFTLIVPSTEAAAIPVYRPSYFYFDVEFVIPSGGAWSQYANNTYNEAGPISEELVYQFARGKMRYLPEATR